MEEHGGPCRVENGTRLRKLPLYSDSRLHFGFGSAASFDRIEVLWPSGLLEQFSRGVQRKQSFLLKY